MILKGFGGPFKILLVSLVLSLLVFSQQITAQEIVVVEQPTSSLVANFADAISALKVRSLAKRAQAIEEFVLIYNPRSLSIMDALLNGKLFERRSDGLVVIAESQGENYLISSAETGDALGKTTSSAIKKIKLSNRLRSRLRLLIALQKLDSDNPDVRLQAVKIIAKKPTEEALLHLKEVAAIEQNQEVKQALQLVFALQDLASDDKSLRLNAVEILKQHTSLEAVSKLKTMLEKDHTGQYNEPEKEIRKSAKSALVKIEARLQVYAVAETVFFGLSLGAVLALAAIGLAITFGVMGVINMAHGEMMMLGAYTTYVM